MGYDTRDIKDLQNKDIATYNYRGYTILRFHKETKTLKITENFEQCKIIPDDLLKMAEFLTECYKFCIGEIEDVAHVRV